VVAEVLDDYAVAQPYDDLGHSVERVHRPVDDGQGLRRERPAIAQSGLEIGHDGVVEVARRQRLLADAGDDGSDVG